MCTDSDMFLPGNDPNPEWQGCVWGHKSHFLVQWHMKPWGLSLDPEPSESQWCTWVLCTMNNPVLLQATIL